MCTPGVEADEHGTDRTTASRERQSREVEQFVYTVSHDLKSPLVTITGFLGLLEQSLASGDRAGAERAVERIRRSAVRMSEMIDGLLRLSCVGQVARETTTVQVGDELRELLCLYEQRLADAGAVVDVAEPLPAVLANRTLLVEAFDNLLSNALKHGATADGLRIRIDHRLTDHELEYRVRDNGPGIPEALHARVFRTFERLDPDSEGSGLGLAIVDRVLSAHDGRVRVESSPGQGATFILAFPRSAVAPSRHLVAQDVDLVAQDARVPDAGTGNAGAGGR